MMSPEMIPRRPGGRLGVSGRIRGRYQGWSTGPVSSPLQRASPDTADRTSHRMAVTLRESVNERSRAHSNLRSRGGAGRGAALWGERGESGTARCREMAVRFARLSPGRHGIGKSRDESGRRSRVRAVRPSGRGPSALLAILTALHESAATQGGNRVIRTQRRTRSRHIVLPRTRARRQRQTSDDSALARAQPAPGLVGRGHELCRSPIC